MRARSANQENYDCNMYSYAKTVKEKVKSVYGELADDGYINPLKDDQIWNTILQAEEDFRLNS